jgi:hypothetical protein
VRGFCCNAYDTQQGIEFTVGIGGAANMDGHAEWANPDENDPNRKPIALFFCDAHIAARAQQTW